MTTEMHDLDEGKLEQVLGQLVIDMGAAMNGALVLIGVDLGLWRALDDAGPVTPEALAERTGIRERYLREWLSAQAASGYLTYDATAGTFALPPEQAMALAREDSPVYLAGGYHLISSVFKDRQQITERIGRGEGFGWHEHDRELFTGTEQFFRPGYRANLVGAWLPALDGVVDKLSAGATVADVGCGHGVSTTLIAQAFPESTVHGFDYHDASIERARELAAAQGVGNADFAVASASDYPGHGYDLICYFDSLHDMGDPVGALRHARDALSDDGTVMLVEPFAHDSLSENLNPVGRMYYAASTVLCTPSSLDQPVSLGLGAQAGEQRLAAVADEAGFGHFRRATETPFNLVLEARP
ncbi:methyltransferase domain-containing protein [Rhodococcus chondri]|uniref:Methyltransferase domain-containing protein n=1 Tax=Rhodococcus chondri TaxID=3065941 RepID=A0ABU7JWW0_9NOCA|nr:methyltransferase domain-containing protein [Rhodococcus sp. CC-R104]MEE2034404.1 methyltransferase domain-containing protein [Rhodococcus sp. CC-R104]